MRAIRNPISSLSANGTSAAASRSRPNTSSFSGWCASARAICASREASRGAASGAAAPAVGVAPAVSAPAGGGVTAVTAVTSAHNADASAIGSVPE